MTYKVGDKVHLTWPVRLANRVGTVVKVVEKAGGFYCVEMDDTKEYLIGPEDSYMRKAL